MVRACGHPLGKNKRNEGNIGMKRNIVLGTMVLLVTSALAADSDSKTEVKNAAKELAAAKDLVGKAKELKSEEGAYSGDLTEEAVKQLVARGPRRPGAEPPEVADAKGTVKFWVKNGVLSKYEYQVQGKMSFNGNDIEINRTTTVAIKDVGSTKVEVPDEAKKKFS